MTNDNNDQVLHPQILRMKKIAEDNGGLLLEMNWKGGRYKYKFMYYKNNKDSIFYRSADSLFNIDRGWPDYKTKPHLLLKSQTSNKTGKEKLTEMSEVALSNGAKLLSTEWKGTKKYYDFESEGKIYKITYQMAVKYKWPKNLENYLLKSTAKQNPSTKNSKLKEIKNLAENYNFQLLSTEYTRKKTPLKFKDLNCDEIFYISHKAILEGKFENQYYGKAGLIAEPVCKQALEHLFGFKFEKRQDILTKEFTGRNSYLELDGYCEELKVAFEYQGHPSHWNSKHPNYEKTFKKDQEKKQFCKQLDIILFQIPDLKKSRNLIAKEVIEIVLNVIKETYIEHNLELPILNKQDFSIDYDKINSSKMMLERLKTLAVDNGANLISTKWKGMSAYYNFEKDGKTFAIKYRKLQEIGWPKNLSKFLSLSAGHKKTNDELFNEIKDFAKIKDLILIDKEWINYEHKYLFKSINGNTNYQYSKKEINRYVQNMKENKKHIHIKKANAFEKLKILATDNGYQLLNENWEGLYFKYQFQKDNQIISINYDYIRKKGFPKDLDKFLKQSKASKAGHITREEKDE